RRNLLSVDSGDHDYYRRREQVPGRLHTRVEPGLRWRRKPLVCVYAGATACVPGVLWGVQKCSAVGRARRRTHASYLVDFSHIAHHTRQAQ
ncbi:unnamed protein product, partial [Ectocarpus fasciculatus]